MLPRARHPNLFPLFIYFPYLFPILPLVWVWRGRGWNSGADVTWELGCSAGYPRAGVQHQIPSTRAPQQHPTAGIISPAFGGHPWGLCPLLGTNEVRAQAGNGTRDGSCAQCFVVPLGCTPLPAPISSTAQPSLWHTWPCLSLCVFSLLQEVPVAPGPIVLEGKDCWGGRYLLFKGCNFFKPKPAPRAFRQVPTATIWSMKLHVAFPAAPERGGHSGGGRGQHKKAPGCSDVRAEIGHSWPPKCGAKATSASN